MKIQLKFSDEDYLCRKPINAASSSFLRLGGGGLCVDFFRENKWSVLISTLVRRGCLSRRREPVAAAMSPMLRRFLSGLNGVSGISGLILSAEATDTNFLRQLRCENFLRRTRMKEHTPVFQTFI